MDEVVCSGRVSDEMLIEIAEYAQRHVVEYEPPAPAAYQSTVVLAMARELLHHRERERQLREAIIGYVESAWARKNLLAVLDSPEGGTTDADT